MRRHCNGTDDTLIRYVPIDEVGDRTVLRAWTPPTPGHVSVPCDCGMVFDDVERMVIYPHAELPSLDAKADEFERWMKRASLDIRRR